MKRLLFVALFVATASLVQAQSGPSSRGERPAPPRPPSSMEGRSNQAGDAPIDRSRDLNRDEGVPGMANPGRRVPGAPGPSDVTDPTLHGGRPSANPPEPMR